MKHVDMSSAVDHSVFKLCLDRGICQLAGLNPDKGFAISDLPTADFAWTLTIECIGLVHRHLRVHCDSPFSMTHAG